MVLATYIINHDDAKVQKDVLKIANKHLYFLLLGIYITKFAYNMGILYIVPTPVGNMEDITLRAIRTLKEVDLVLAEDTRTTGVLLKQLGIEVAHLQSHHKFNEHGTSAGIVERLKAGQNIALVSDLVRQASATLAFSWHAKQLQQASPLTVCLGQQHASPPWFHRACRAIGFVSRALSLKKKDERHILRA